jgi:[ribosomal protein S5]-alanine N-acetyltransferase
LLVRFRQEVQEVPRRLRRPSPPLADDAVKLEPLDSRYVPDFERLVVDPEIVRNTRVPAAPPPGFAATWVGRYEQGWQDGSRAGFAILSREDEFLGMAAIVDLDLDAQQGEIGYLVAEPARGRGVAGRALRLVTDWALGDLGLRRVELLIDVDNAASIRVADRAGYRREGVLRSFHIEGDRRADMIVYSLLPDDLR